MIFTDPSQFSDLHELIHDRWFNVEHVLLDPETRSVVIHIEPSGRALRWGGSARGAIFTVRNVEDLMINNTEKVRDYDINEVTYDEATRTLVLAGCIPIEIVFRVTRLELVVEELHPQTGPGLAPR
jgi:hypothetical protein